MHMTALIGMCCFLWYLALWATVFSSAATLVTLAAALGLVFLVPRGLGRLTNERLCVGGLKLGTTLLRNAAVFLPYTALTVGLFVWFSNRTNNVSAALYHIAGQALFWLLGALAVYLPDNNSQIIPPSLCIFAAVPAILLLANTGAQVSVVLLCVVGWYFSLVFSLAAKSKTPSSQAAVLLHSLIPLAVVILTVGLVFSGSLNLFFSQVKHLLLMVWQLILMLLKLLDTPPDAYALEERKSKAFDEAIALAQEYGPVNTLPIIIFGICFAVITLVMLVRLLIGLLSLRLPHKAPAARSPWRSGAGLPAAIRLLGLLLRGLAEGALAVALALARLARLLCRLAKKRLLALMPPKTPLESVLRSYRGLLGYGHLLRIHHTRSETPMEYLDRLQALSLRRPVPLTEAQALTWHFVAVQYGGVVPSWQTAAECRRLLRKIRRSGRMIFTRSKTDRSSLPNISEDFK